MSGLKGFVMQNYSSVLVLTGGSLCLLITLGLVPGGRSVVSVHAETVSELSEPPEGPPRLRITASSPIRPPHKPRSAQSATLWMRCDSTCLWKHGSAQNPTDF